MELSFEIPIYRQLSYETRYPWKGDWADLIRYKFITGKEVPDCDSCPEVLRFYGEAYGRFLHWNGESLVGRKSGLSYGGDTLTSAITVFKRYLAAKIGAGEAEPLKDYFEATKAGVLASGDLRPDKLFEVKIRYADEGGQAGIAFSQMVGEVLSEEAKKFLKNYLTLGNFLPVPPGFNSQRSNYGKWDTVDRMLYVLYGYFVEESEGTSSLANLFLGGEKLPASVENVQKWMEDFGVSGRGMDNWCKFTEANHFTPFLDESHRPIALKTGKAIQKTDFLSGRFAGSLLPSTVAEHEIFFANANRCIEQRGRQAAR